MNSNARPEPTSTIIVVTEYVSPFENSTGEYYFDIVTALLEANFNVLLVTPGTEVNKRTCECLGNSWQNFFQVFFSRDFSDYSNSKIKAVGWLLSALSIWYQVIRLSRKSNLIFFGTNPTFISIFNAFSLLFWKHKSVLLCYDIFPDNFIALTDKKYKRIFGKLIKPIFHMSLKKTNKILVIGDCMAAYLLGLGVKRRNIVKVSNWANGSDLFPLGISEIESNIKFQFLGNLGPLQGIENILASFYHVKSKNVDFTFAGKGKLCKSIEQFIGSNHTVVNVDYIGSVDRAERNYVLNDCDIAVVSLDKRITGMGVPSKAYYSLAAGKPLLVIADAQCETSRIVNEYGLGWVVSSGSVHDIAQTIDKIANDPAVIPDSSHIRNIFEKNFDRRVGTERILNAVIDEFEN